MKVKKIKFRSAGYELVGEIDFPNTFRGKLPTVILFHGLTNTREDCPLISETAEALTQNGFIAFRFDFFGSGESPGQLKDKQMDILEQNAEDAIDFISKNKNVDKNRIGLWGRSIGGTLVCSVPPNSKTKARVTLSPTIKLEKEFKEIFKRLRKKELALEKLGKKLPGTGKYKGKYEFGKGWFDSLKGLDKKILDNLKKLKRVLVLGTALDQKVTPDNACMVVNTVKEPKRIMIYMTDHDYAGFKDEALEETINWFKTYLK